MLIAWLTCLLTIIHLCYNFQEYAVKFIEYSENFAAPVREIPLRLEIYLEECREKFAAPDKKIAIESRFGFQQKLLNLKLPTSKL